MQTPVLRAGEYPDVFGSHDSIAVCVSHLRRLFVLPRNCTAVQFTAHRHPSPDRVRVDWDDEPDAHEYHFVVVCVRVDGRRRLIYDTAARWIKKAHQRGLYYFACWIVTP